jgi:hypothetical protein
VRREKRAEMGHGSANPIGVRQKRFILLATFQYHYRN